MREALELHPEYIVDAAGNRVRVVLSIGEFEELLETLDDLATAARRKDEPTIAHGEVLGQLKRDGLL